MDRAVYQQTVIDNSGVPVNGATVFVYQVDTTTEVTIYDAKTGGSTITQPITTSTDGLIKFYVPNGRYDIKITNGATVKTLEDVEIGVQLDYVSVDKIGSPTFTDAQQISNVYKSAGVINGSGTITDGGGGTIDVALTNVLIRSTDSDTADLFTATIAAVTGLALTDTTLNYIYVEYNAGSPQIVARTSESTNYNTDILLGTAYRSGTSVYINDKIKHIIGNNSQKSLRRSLDTERVARKSGASISASGTRNFALTAGTLWEGLNRFTTNAFDSSVSDTFTYWYRDGGGGWTSVASQTQINNTQYDNNSGTLATLSNNKYGVHWVYMTTDSAVHVVYGQADYSLTDANAASAPSTIPPIVSVNGFLVGKITIEKSASTFTAIITGFSDAIAFSAASDHGALAGLSDDDHAQYALLAGRSGGQTLVGGTGSADPLRLQSTSHGTKGNVLFGTSTTTYYDETADVWYFNGAAVFGTNDAAASGNIQLKGGSGTSAQFRFFDAGTERARVGVANGTTLLKLSGTNSLANHLTIDSTGKCGFNTTSASAKADIVVANGDNTKGLEVNQNDTTNNPICFHAVNTGSGNSVQVNTSDFVVKGSTGRVGVGVASPDEMFHVVGTSVLAPSSERAAYNNIANSAAVVVDFDATGILQISAASSGNNNRNMQLRALSSGTVNEGQLFLHHSGSIGIGATTDPNYKLEVNGSFGFSPGTSVTPADNGDVVIEATNNTTLTFKLKGTDGTVRTATLTLA